MAEAKTTSRLFAWCQLLRVPNLLTVPGDAIVGFLAARVVVAQAGPGATGPANVVPLDRPWALAGLAVVAALALYMRGLITNDICDLAEDRRERPDRPLPSGRVHLSRAFVTAAGLGLAGIVAAGLTGVRTMAVAAALVLLIWAYNRHLKRVTLAGPLAMGACRGLSVLLGAAAGGAIHAGLPVALVWLVYIAAVTYLAAGETGETPPRPLTRCLPLLVIWAWIAWTIAVPIVRTDLQAKAYIAAQALRVSLLLATIYYARMAGRPGAVPRAIGGLIRLLLVMQAVAMISVLGENWPLGLLPLALLPVSMWLGRRFYAS